MQSKGTRSRPPPSREEEGLPGATHGAVLVAAGVQVGGCLKGCLLSIQQVGEHAPVVVLQQHLRSDSTQVNEQVHAMYLAARMSR